MAEMSWGYVLPTSTGADVVEAEVIWQAVDEVERSDFEYLWVSDHLLWWHPMLESLSTLAAISARTSRLKVGTAVLQLAMREIVATAKSLATIDRLSGGRLVVGVGVGGEFAPEWEATRTERKTRGRRTDEMIRSLRGLWAGSPHTARSAHVHLESVDLHPKPTSRIPIWIGGRKPPALRRAAELGDAWMGLFLTPQMFEERIRDLHALCAENGRNPHEVSSSMYAWTCVAPTDEAAEETASKLLSAFYNVDYERLRPYAVVGSPRTCAKRFRAFRDSGVEHLAIAPISVGIELDQLRLLREEVIVNL